MHELPQGWRWAPLGDLLLSIETGKSFKCEERPPSAEEVGVVKVSAVSWGRYQEGESKTCLDANRVNPELFIAPGDFLFSRANTIELIGACVIADTVRHRVMLSDKILRFQFADAALKPWVLQALRSKQGRQQIEALASGNQESMRNIGQEKIQQIQIPIPPEAERLRIVAKLEELLSDLDAGVAELKAAQKKLARYRQSLLKAAVTGELTTKWRAASALNTSARAENGQELLQRILTERRTRWQARQLAKFQQQGKTPPKDWQKKYPEPVQSDTSGLPALPQGWVWASLSQVGWLDRGRSKHRPRNAPHLYGGPYPFIQTGDIRHADTFMSDVEASYSEAGLAQSRLWPAGTICITIAANIGKTAILSTAACFPDSVVGFLTGSNDVSVRYVEYFMRSVQQKLEDEAPATAQKNINLEILEKVVIPVPSIQEQHQIVMLLDDAIGASRETDRSIERSLKQSTAQRQNILRAAFAGQLVPQDPNDEPASVLLERIRAERAAQVAVMKPRGRKAKEAA